MRPTAAQTAGAARLPGLLQLAGSVHPLADLWSSRLGLPALLGQHNRIVTENS
jgi:hypothetical protein